MSSFPNDANIPLLTEIIPLDAEEQADEATALMPLPLSAASAASIASDPVMAPIAFSTPSTPRPPDLTTPEETRMSTLPEQESLQWEQLVRETGDQVLKKLHARIDHVLEQQVRDQLADVLQLAVADMTSQIQTGLRDTLHKVIAQAVQEEVYRLKRPDL